MNFPPPLTNKVASIY